MRLKDPQQFMELLFEELKAVNIDWRRVAIAFLNFSSNLASKSPNEQKGNQDYPPVFSQTLNKLVKVDRAIFICIGFFNNSFSFLRAIAQL